MKVLLTGSNGQLGRELTRQLKQKKIDHVGYDIPEFDITDKEKMTVIIAKEQPTVIVNCGALTNVDGCETQKELAMAINAAGPKSLAEIARDQDIVLVQVSTDYVFDGGGISLNGVLRPYVEADPIDPKTVYGESKAAGEKAVVETTPKYFVIRTAWLYGDGNNFVKTMLELASKHPKLTVVNDQVGSPTSTVDLAAAIIDLMQTDHYGTYHGTCEGQCSWYDFAVEIFRLSGIKVAVEPVTSEQFVRPAPRPKYSVLENKALNDLNMNHFRPWQVSLAEYLKNLN
ncbi:MULTISPECIES: dTDP-4-dehydrorhamnose reductase [Acetobacterium]|jgi:dTDP-4-dehydrorhamnose reductase (EC 1.1.1.133)|uniref:dTDP-4-dehydrorhamnose reductase n=1 Tax=Acetobacterium TaxID=33951 RepID=UPI002ACAF844|nr:dTDP-4-dehydrorhamnose reductase [Acetobacterium sp. K1/6]MDZ5724326.1 dTDP-4-dehydrorhamnose reductase [Acetobacterium sp. K1/6]